MIKKAIALQDKGNKQILQRKENDGQEKGMTLEGAIQEVPASGEDNPFRMMLEFMAGSIPEASSSGI